MGNLELEKITSSQEYDSNILSQYKFICTMDEIKNICSTLIGCDLLSENRRLYIYGYGSQPKSVYKKLSKESGEQYDLLWNGYNGPRKYKLLSYLTASYSGLVRIKKISCITSILEELSHLAMAGIFSISENYSLEFENYILSSKKGLVEMPDDFIKRDKSFFYYVLDGDTYHSEEDESFLCQAAFGKECPDCLFKIIGFTSRRW